MTIKKIVCIGLTVMTFAAMTGCSDDEEREVRRTHTETIAKESGYTVRVEKNDDEEIVRIEKAYTELDSSGNYKHEVFWEDDDWYRD